MSKTEAVGLSSARVDRIRPAVEKYISDDKIAGAVTLVARRGRIAHLECYGLSSRETGTPMEEDTIFRIYSMTKPITAVALLCLYERGEFQLTNPVSRFISGIDKMKVDDAGRQVDQQSQMNIWHLLTHTAGFTYPSMGSDTIRAAYQEHVRLSQTPLAELIDGLQRTPLAFQPGVEYRYGFSLDVAARLVEIISGKSYYRFLKDEIFDPLGMVDTYFSLPQDKTTRLASMYGMTNLDVESSEEENQRAFAEFRNVLLADSASDYVSQPHEHYRGGHGLVSTVMDYYRFCEMLLGGGAYNGVRVLGRKTVELMAANHLPAALLPYESGGEKEFGYGHGFGVRVMLDPGQAHKTGSIGEFGWGGAASTYFWIDPVEEFIGIQMAQYQPSGPYQIGTDFRAAAYQAIVD